TRDVPEGAVMVGIPARSTLVDAKDYAREFVPYGTPCQDLFDPATQKLELLQCQVLALQGQIATLMAERDAAADAARPAPKKGRTGG
ncbi:MAG: hypothetical protein RLZZ58_1031, partial [Pseudomonadota bacterium]